MYARDHPNGTLLSHTSDQATYSNGPTKSQHPFGASVNKSTSSTHLYENARPKFLGDLSRNGSEADSLIELYRQQQKGEVNRRSAEAQIEIGDATESDDISSKWVHRDKLTMIEIQEYKDRGMEVPPELLARAGIRPESRRSKKGRQESQERGKKEGKRQRMRSPSPEPVEEYNDVHYIPDDPRTAEEIEADPHEDNHHDAIYQQGKLRSSSSRIPLATASPHPIPTEHLERSTPLPRKRAQSTGDVEEDPLAYGKSRSRANSLASQVLLDDGEMIESVPNSPESPSKRRASKGQGHSRKTSATIKIVPNSTSTKSRTPSATTRNSPGARPSTRSGLDGRPRTAVNPPEGDPPWLDSMYKPDPRLPPDKQMLPTHAKRLMQEQWEKEGKAGSVYDRNFTPVAVVDDSQILEKPSRPTEEQRPHPLPKREDSLPREWPMKPNPNPETPKSPSSEHAGYSTMPRLQNTPSLTAIQSPRVQRPEQALQAEETEKKTKGCGCCVVM